MTKSRVQCTCGISTTQGSGAGEESMQSHRTKGHIVSLTPTTPAAMDLDVFKDAMIAAVQPNMPAVP